MRLTIRHNDPYPLTYALARGGGMADGEMARMAAGAALRAAGPGAAPGAASLSHRDGRAAAALAPIGMRIGIDLERARAIPREHERMFATSAERRAWPRGRDASGLWALKEAAWKAFGCPDDLPFTALELEIGRGGTVSAVRVGDRAHAARSLLRRPWPGWVLALVWAEEAP